MNTSLSLIILFMLHCSTHTDRCGLKCYFNHNNKKMEIFWNLTPANINILWGEKLANLPIFVGKNCEEKYPSSLEVNLLKMLNVTHYTTLVRLHFFNFSASNHSQKWNIIWWLMKQVGNKITILLSIKIVRFVLGHFIDSPYKEYFVYLSSFEGF